MRMTLYRLLKNYYKYCECGCKELIKCYTRNGFRKFKDGHQTRGQNHPMWKDGFTHDSAGYIYDYRPNHPYRSNNNKVADHRLVYEHYLKILFDEDIYIPSYYHIHHINENVQDNSLINLEILPHPEHTKIHFPKKDRTNTFCVICGGKTRIKNGYEDWCGNEKDGWKCHKCYIKEYMKGYLKEYRKRRRDRNE